MEDGRVDNLFSVMRRGTGSLISHSLLWGTGGSDKSVSVMGRGQDDLICNSLLWAGGGRIL